MIACLLCQREFADGLALYTHTEMAHTPERKKEWRCTVCWEVHQDLQSHVCQQLSAAKMHPDMAVGRKDDSGKPRFDLMPLHAYKAVIDVLTYGAGKYAPENWRKVEGWRWRYYRAALGHIWKWACGEHLDTDPDAAGNVSNLPHLAHAVCCLLFILELDEGEKK